jgi:hypothetical protein
MSKKRAIGFCGGLALLAGLALQGRGQGVPQSAIRNPLDPASPLGVMYCLPYMKMHQSPDAAHAYRDLGTKWIKFQGIQWERVEPRPPVGGRHRYDWAILDGRVREWQAAGYTIQCHLDVKCGWAATPFQGSVVDRLPSTNAVLRKALEAAARPPKEEHWADYAAWVQAVAERYDADGMDDMPGLLAPVVYFEIMNEAQNLFYFNGTPEDYVRLLRVSREALLRANPRAKVIYHGITWNGLPYGNVDEAALRRRFEEWTRTLPADFRAGLQHGENFVRQTLQATDLYDAVDLHANATDQTMRDDLLYLRRLLRGLGVDRPIWIGDSTSVPPLAFNPMVDPVDPRPRDAAQYLRILGNKRHPRYAAVRRWYLAEQAKMTTKKVATALGLGCERFLLGLLEDWPWFAGEAYMHHGLVDTDYQLLTGKITYRSPRPVYYTVRLLTQKLHGYTTSQELANAAPNRSRRDNRLTPPRPCAYQFTSPGRSTFILWCEGGVQQGVGEPEATIVYDLPVASPSVTVTHLLTEEGQTTPRVEKVKTGEGKARLTLTEAPIIVEEEGRGGEGKEGGWRNGGTEERPDARTCSGPLPPSPQQVGASGPEG